MVQRGWCVLAALSGGGSMVERAVLVRKIGVRFPPLFVVDTGCL